MFCREKSFSLPIGDDRACCTFLAELCGKVKLGILEVAGSDQLLQVSEFCRLQNGSKTLGIVPERVGQENQCPRQPTNFKTADRCAKAVHSDYRARRARVLACGFLDSENYFFDYS